MVFRLRNVKVDGRSIQTCLPESDDRNKSGHYYTILIGRNGTGKSRLLAEVCRAFRAWDNQAEYQKESGFQLRLLEGFEINFSLQDQHDSLHLYKDVPGQRSRSMGRELPLNDESYLQSNSLSCMPTRVVATTISPFDKFPISEQRIRNDVDDEYNAIYRYLGSKNDAGNLTRTGQINRVIESLIYASERKRSELKRLSHVFGFMKYFPKITVDYRIRISQASIFSLRERGKELQEKEVLEKRAKREGLGQKYSTLGELENLIKFGGMRSSLRSEFEKRPQFISELCNALDTVLTSNFRGRFVTIAFNFEDSNFEKGSLEVFKKILFLRKIGLLSFENLRLLKISPEKSPGQ